MAKSRSKTSTIAGLPKKELTNKRRALFPKSIAEELDFTEEDLLRMTRNEAIEGLSEKAQGFCEYYVVSWNAKTAAVKAGYSIETAKQAANRMKRDYRHARYIMWLKVNHAHNRFIKAGDVMAAMASIAFADITDFVEIKDNKMKLRDGEAVDGRVIKKIKKGKDGAFEIELEDRMKAFDYLQRWFNDMPKEWRHEVELKKIEIAKERNEIEKQKVVLLSQDNANDEDTDNFIELLAKAAKVGIWDENK